jgi:hypothetical protein
MTTRKLETENQVKALVKEWYDLAGAWSYAPIQTGMGTHGIPDRIGCVPIVVTHKMVGEKLGLFVAVEAKRPGRRGEYARGLSRHQKNNLAVINLAGGLAICCDGADDLQLLELRIQELANG